MEAYQCEYCNKILKPIEVIEFGRMKVCIKCALEKVIRPEPTYCCNKCSRYFYEHEVVEVDVGTVCTACLCEYLYLLLKDIESRLEAAEEDIATLFKQGR